MTINKLCYPLLSHLLFLSLSCTTAYSAATIRIDNHLLNCISQIETGATTNQLTTTYNDKRIGSKNEVGRCQILPTVWKQYRPFKRSYYQNPRISYEVTKEIFVDRINSYKNYTGRMPNIIELYILWNNPGVLYNKSKRRVSTKVMERAIRFKNLYETIKTQTK